MSEPKTLKEWLIHWHQKCIPDWDNEPCETCTKTNPEKSRQCIKAEESICRLIEKFAKPIPDLRTADEKAADEREKAEFNHPDGAKEPEEIEGKAVDE